MRYAIAIEEGDDKHAFGVAVPDLPGCYSAGDTLEEALENAKEAILLHLEDLAERGEAFPRPRPIADMKADYEGWTWAYTDVDALELSGPAERVNITMPKVALKIIDGAAKKLGETRSAYLMRAAVQRAQDFGRDAKPGMLVPLRAAKAKRASVKRRPAKKKN